MVICPVQKKVTPKQCAAEYLKTITSIVYTFW